MAELVRYRGQVTSKSADSNLQPVTSRTVFVTKRGATTSSGATTSTIPLEAGGLRFTVGDKVIVEGDESTYRPVGAVTSDTEIVLGGGTITFSEGDRIVNLGADTGSTAPAYDGYASTEFIYTDPVDSGTEADDNKVTTDSTDGEYGFWVRANRGFDLHIMDSDGKLGSTSETKPDQFVSGVDSGSDVPDSGTNVAHVFDTSNALTGTTKIASFRNNGTEKAGIEDDGDVTCVDLTPSGNVSVGGTLHATGNFDTDGTLVVDGASTLTGNVSCGGTLGVTGAVTHTSTTAISDDVTVAEGKVVKFTTDGMACVGGFDTAAVTPGGATKTLTVGTDAQFQVLTVADTAGEATIDISKTSAVEGAWFCIRIEFAGSGNSPTADVNNGAAGSTILPGDIAAGGVEQFTVVAVYDGSDWKCMDVHKNEVT